MAKRNNLANYMALPTNTHLHAAVIADEEQIYGHIAPIEENERKTFIKNAIK